MAPAIPFKHVIGSVRRPGRAGAPAQSIQRNPARADSKSSQSQGQSESQAQQEKQPYRSGYKINPALEDLDLDSNSNSNKPTAVSSHSSTNKNHNENSGDDFDVKAFALQNHFNRIFPSLENLDEPESVEWTQACTDESDTPATGESKSLTREKVVDEFLSVSYGELKEGETEEDRDLSQYDEADQFAQAQAQEISQGDQTMQQQIQKRGLGEFAGDDERDPGYDDHDKDDGMSKHESKFKGLEESSEKQHQSNESQQQENEGSAQEEDDRADLLEDSITRSGLGSKLRQLDSALDDEHDNGTGKLIDGSYSSSEHGAPFYSANGSEENMQQEEDEQDHAEILEGKVVNTISRNKGLDVLRFDMETIDEVPEWAKDCTSDIAVPPTVLNKEKKVVVVDNGRPGKRKPFTASSVFRDFMNGDTDIEKRLERGAPVNSSHLQRRSAVPDEAPKRGKRRYRLIRTPLKMRSGLRSDPIHFSGNQQWKPVSQAVPAKIHRRFVPPAEDDDEEFDDELFPINPDYKAYALREPYHHHCGVREKPIRIATDRVWKPVDQVMHHFQKKASKSDRKSTSIEESTDNNADNASSENQGLQKRSVETDEIADEEPWQKVNQQDDTKDLIHNFWDEEDRGAGGDWGNVVTFMGDKVFKDDKRQARKAQKAAARAERARMESFASEAAKAEIAYAKYPQLRDNQYADDYYYHHDEPEYELPFDYSRGTYKGQGYNGAQTNGTQPDSQGKKSHANVAQASQVSEYSAKNAPATNGKERADDTKEAHHSVSDSADSDAHNDSAETLSFGEKPKRKYADGAVLTGYEDDDGEWIEIVYIPDTPGKLEIDGWPYMTGYADEEKGWVAAPFTREIAESVEKFTRGTVVIEGNERPWTVGFHAPDGKWWEALCMPTNAPIKQGIINVVEDQDIEIVEEIITIEEPKPTSKKEVGWFVESENHSDGEEEALYNSHVRQWLDVPSESEESENEEDPITKVDGTVQVKVDETSNGELQSHQSVVEAVSTTGGNGRNTEGNYRYDRVTEYKAPRVRPSRTTPRLQRRDLPPNPASSAEPNNDLDAVATWNLHKKVIAEKNGNLHTITDSGNPSASFPTGTSTLSNSHHFSSNADGVALKVPKMKIGGRRNRKPRKERGGFIERMLEQEGELAPPKGDEDAVIPEMESLITFEETLAAPMASLEPLPPLGAPSPVAQRNVGRPAPINNKALPFQQVKYFPGRRQPPKQQKNRAAQTQGKEKAHGKAPQQTTPAPAKTKVPTPIKQVMAQPSMVQEIQYDATISPLSAPKGAQVQRAQAPSRVEKVTNAQASNRAEKISKPQAPNRAEKGTAPNRVDKVTNINAEGVTFNPLVDTNVNLKLKLGTNEKGQGRKYHYKNGDVTTGDRVVDSPRGGSHHHGSGRKEEHNAGLAVAYEPPYEGSSLVFSIAPTVESFYTASAQSTYTTSSAESSSTTSAPETTSTTSTVESTSTLLALETTPTTAAPETTSTTSTVENTTSITSAPETTPTTSTVESTTTTTSAVESTTTSTSSAVDSAIAFVILPSTSVDTATTSDVASTITASAVESTTITSAVGSATTTTSASITTSVVVPSTTADTVTVTTDVTPVEETVAFTEVVEEVDTTAVGSCPLIPQIYETVSSIGEGSIENLRAAIQKIDTLMETYRADILAQNSAALSLISDIIAPEIDSIARDIVSQLTTLIDEADQGVYVAISELQYGTEQAILAVQYEGYKFALGIRDVEQQAIESYEALVSGESISEYISFLDSANKTIAVRTLSDVIEQLQDTTTGLLEAIIDELPSQFYPIVEQLERDGATLFESGACQPTNFPDGDDETMEGRLYYHYSLCGFEGEIREGFNPEAFGGALKEGHFDREDEESIFGASSSIELEAQSSSDEDSFVADSSEDEYSAQIVESSQKESSQKEYSQGKSSEIESAQIESSQKESSQKESSQKKSSQKEASQKEASQKDSSQTESSQIESSQKESSQNESSQGKSSESESSQGQASQSSQNEVSQGKSSQGESSQGESSASFIEISQPGSSASNSIIEAQLSSDENSFGSESSEDESSAQFEQLLQTSPPAPVIEPAQYSALWTESDSSDGGYNTQWIDNSQGDNLPPWLWQFHDSSSSSEDSDSQTTETELENPFHVKTYRSNYRPAHHRMVESTVTEEKAPREASTSTDSHSRSQSASSGHSKRDVYDGSQAAKDFHREPLPDVVGDLSLFLQDRRLKSRLHKRRLPTIDPHNAEDWQKLDRVTMKKPEDVSSSLRSSLSKAVSKTHTKDSTKDTEPVDLVAEEIVEVEEVDEVPYRPVIKNEQVPGGFWDKYLTKAHKLGGHYTTDESQHIPSVSSHTSSSTSDVEKVEKVNEKIAEAMEKPRIQYLAKRDFNDLDNLEVNVVMVDSEKLGLQRTMAMLDSLEDFAVAQQQANGLGFTPVAPLQRCATRHTMHIGCLGVGFAMFFVLWVLYLGKYRKERARRAIRLTDVTETEKA